MHFLNKATQFQTKGGIRDEALRVTYYSSQEIVSCNFIFNLQILDNYTSVKDRKLSWVLYSNRAVTSLIQ